MENSTQFAVENIEGTAVVSGLTEELIEVKPGERVILTQETSLTVGDVRPGLRDASHLKDARS
jgi:hypothetical protein